MNKTNNVRTFNFESGIGCQNGSHNLVFFLRFWNEQKDKIPIWYLVLLADFPSARTLIYFRIYFSHCHMARIMIRVTLPKLVFFGLSFVDFDFTYFPFFLGKAHYRKTSVQLVNYYNIAILFGMLTGDRNLFYFAIYAWISIHKIGMHGKCILTRDGHFIHVIV